jgi:hypothetical protein
MRHRKIGFISALILFGLAVAAAGVAVYTNYLVKASEADYQQALNILPSDCQFVFGINVQKVVLSPIYERFRQRQDQPTSDRMAEFTEKTGIDPAHDVYYLLIAGRSISLPNSAPSVEKAQGKGVIVIIGRFNEGAITAYIRSKTTPVEMQYAGRSVLLIPEPNKDAVDRGIVFLSDREVALGDLDSLKAVLDVKGSGKPSIMFNPTMANLIDSIGSEEMVWFAGDTSRVLAKAPTTTPLGENIETIQNVVGTLSITDAVSGRITVTANSTDSATKLADVGRGFVAFAQLAGDKNPDLKLLLSGFQVSQDDARVSVALNLPIDLIEKLESLRKLPGQTTGN